MICLIPSNEVVVNMATYKHIPLILACLATSYVFAAEQQTDNVKNGTAEPAASTGHVVHVEPVDAFREPVYADVDHQDDTEPNEQNVIYVEAEGATYRGTRAAEHCYYHDEHDHIHCEEKAYEPRDRVVYVESHSTRSTRHHHRHRSYYGDRHHGSYYSPGFNFVIGLPLSSYRHHYRHRSYGYDHGYRGRYHHGKNRGHHGRKHKKRHRRH